MADPSRRRPGVDGPGVDGPGVDRTSAAVVGVDVGGTNVAAGLVTAEGRVQARAKRPTPTSGGLDALLDAVGDAVGEVCAEPAGVGVGLPGPVRDGRLLAAVNLPGVEPGADVAGALAARLGCPVRVDNDANAGLLGELTAGAARAARAALGCWVGTGVGGALVLDGRVHRGAHGRAGELGHVTVEPDGGRRCACGAHGCLETVAGRRAMQQTAEQELAGGAESALARLRRDRDGRMTSRAWAEALAEGDELATALIDRAGDALGVAVASAACLVDLDVVVLGGGMVEREPVGARLAERVRRRVAAHPMLAEQPPAVVAGELGDDAGLIGAAGLVGRRPADQP